MDLLLFVCFVFSVNEIENLYFCDLFYFHVRFACDFLRCVRSTLEFAIIHSVFFCLRFFWYVQLLVPRTMMLDLALRKPAPLLRTRADTWGEGKECWV